MTRTAALLVALLLPMTSRAQQDLGLDLTTDQPPTKEAPKTEKAETPAKKSEKAAPSTEGEAAAGKAESNEEQAEREVILQDRVKAVQKKVYLKKSRFEISPFIGFSVNDPYYSKFVLSGTVAYYLADTLAIGGRFSWIQLQRSDDARTAMRALQSRISVSVPDWAAMVDAFWSPIYGKVTIFNSILHFDAYVVGGMGVVTTDGSSACIDPSVDPTTTPNCSRRGPNSAFDLGVGMKFVVKDYLAVNAALINTTYVDVPTGTSGGLAIAQNLMTLNIGMSLFIPFKSTGRESE